MKGKSLLAALIALGIFSGSAYAAPSFKQSGNKFTINEGADDAAVQALKGADMTKLALTLNNVKDVDLQKVCAAVPELRTLNIENSEELTSIAPVAGLKKLTVFTLSAEKVKDFSPLSGLTGLTKLQVASDAMGPDLKWMSGLTKINSLAVSGGPSLTSMEGLPSLPGLRSARISHGVFADHRSSRPDQPGAHVLHDERPQRADQASEPQIAELLRIPGEGLQRPGRMPEA